MRTATFFDSELGRAGAIFSPRGLQRLYLPGPDLEAHLRAQSDALVPRKTLHGESATLLDQLSRYGSGDPSAWPEEAALDLAQCTPFQQACYHQLRRTTSGETVSYGALGRACGWPNAARSVGHAMATNPLPLVVPCHRVLPASGALGAFSSALGPAQKLALLSIEGASLDSIAREGVRELKRADPLLGAAIKRVGPFRLDPPLKPILRDGGIADGVSRERQAAFLSLCRAIVHQQVSVAAGRTIFERLVRTVGAGEGLSPAGLAAAPESLLRSCGVSRQKASYLLDLAQRVGSGSLCLEGLRHRCDEAVIAALSEVRGIARWSAQMFLIFHLGRLDVLPVDDLGLRKGLACIDGLTSLPSAAELTRRAELWAPFRSVASWYCWQAINAAPAPSPS